MNENLMDTTQPTERHWLRVMPDYSSTGLWNSRGYNIEVDSIPISAAIVKRLAAWCDWFEEGWKTLHDEVDTFDSAGFSLEGREIAKAIKRELPSWTIVYFDEEKSIDAVARKDRSLYEYEITLD